MMDSTPVEISWKAEHGKIDPSSLRGREKHAYFSTELAENDPYLRKRPAIALNGEGLIREVQRKCG
jgi:hypothetical protein